MSQVGPRRTVITGGEVEPDRTVLPGPDQAATASVSSVHDLTPQPVLFTDDFAGTLGLPRTVWPKPASWLTSTSRVRISKT